MHTPSPALAAAAAGASGRRPRAVLAMRRGLAGRLIDERTLSRFTELADLDPDLVLDDFATAAAAAVLAETEVIISSWGCPPIDSSVLAAAPKLRAVLHAAGSVKHHITDACWERGIQVTSAADVNALPVAEYTVAAILFANKAVLRLATEYRRRRGTFDWLAEYTDIGNHRRTVGVVGASRIGRRVIELLRPHGPRVLLYDPYVTEAEAARLGVQLVSLDRLCGLSDVVTIHAPQLPETRHLIDHRMLGRMRDGATVVNTARGSLIDQDALARELVSGRLNAVLDVTTPDVPLPDSPLFDLPNVLLTPHIAGSLGTELHRMAEAIADELARYVAGVPFAYRVERDEISRTA
ncbi:hydroxyacid dehydrogenase [Amycolatopsis sp. CA-128772]|uniref:hydroxyacid dehydrogenase n=1 Tax=Amycolatopsis sp. CA-128772 TaxID=2073159 RepID=UPI000CD24A06|nr:hydroxyacid dehydrogenase [Amycolatopsis sp. CA-128772]